MVRLLIWLVSRVLDAVLRLAEVIFYTSSLFEATRNPIVTVAVFSAGIKGNYGISSLYSLRDIARGY